MLYYVFFSMKAYGGDDGLAMRARSDFLPALGLKRNRFLLRLPGRLCDFYFRAVPAD